MPPGSREGTGSEDTFSIGEGSDKGGGAKSEQLSDDDDGSDVKQRDDAAAEEGYGSEQYSEDMCADDAASGPEEAKIDEEKEASEQYSEGENDGSEQHSENEAVYEPTPPKALVPTPPDHPKEEPEPIWDDALKYDEDYLRKLVPPEVVKAERVKARREARAELKTEEKAVTDHRGTNECEYTAEEEQNITELQAVLKNLTGADGEYVTAVKAVFLSQCAYRVPTGTEFWDIIGNIKEGRSKVSVSEAYRKYQKRALAATDVVQKYLKNVSLCVGVKFVHHAHTALSVELADVQAVLDAEDDSLDDATTNPPDESETELLSNVEPPKIAPGWLISKESGSEIWVTVAGTQNPDDSFRDCMFIPTPLVIPLEEGEMKAECLEVVKKGLVKVHHGFLDGAVKVFEQVKGAVGEASEGKEVTVNLAGHSLGGATALLLAIFFSSWDNPNIKLGEVFTFGAPNVFYFDDDTTTAPLVKKLLTPFELHSFINHRDIVPRALGAPLIKKLAKLLIKVGVKALQNLSPENSDYLLKYRNVASKVYYMTPPDSIELIEDETDQQKVLNFGVLDCRPAAGIHHKMGNYIERMLCKLRGLTSHQHPWVTEDGGSGNDENPTAGRIYDKKDPTILSTGFLTVLDNVFDELKTSVETQGEEGQVTVDIIRKPEFAKLCFWTSKHLPFYVIIDLFQSAKYEVLNPDDPGLSRDGWKAFVESQCSTDLPWIGRLLDVAGKKPSERGEFDAGTYPEGGRVLEGNGSMLSKAALEVVSAIFNGYAKEGVMWYDCLRSVMGKIEENETGVPPPVSHVVNITRNILVEMKKAADLRAKQAESNVDAPKPAPDSLSSFDLSNPVQSYITKNDFTELIWRWAVEDEVRIWQIFDLFGATMQLEVKSVANVHDGEDVVCCCNNMTPLKKKDGATDAAGADFRAKVRELTKRILLQRLNAIVLKQEEDERAAKEAERREKRRKMKPALPRMYHGYIQPAHSVVANPTTAAIKRNPEKAFATVTAANAELEKQIRAIKKKLGRLPESPKSTLKDLKDTTATVSGYSGTTRTEGRWEALNTKLQKENSMLKTKIAGTPDYHEVTSAIEKHTNDLKEKERQLAELRKVNRKLTRLAKCRGESMIGKEGLEKKIAAEKVGNQKELVFIRRSIDQMKAEAARLNRFKERQVAELERLPVDVPAIDVKALQKLIDTLDDMDVSLQDRRKELVVTKNSALSESKKMTRLTSDQQRRINELNGMLVNLQEVLQTKEDQLASNTRATSAGRVLQQGKLRPVKHHPVSP